jgi:Zn-dependent protease with chaperone function
MMNWRDVAFELGFFFIKSPFRNLWPLVVAPAVAALISDRTARLVPRTPAGSITSAALAATPGLVALVMIVHAVDFIPISTWRGVVAHRITPLVAAALVAYAIYRAFKRQSEIAHLFALAAPASGQLARAAERLGLRALEILSDEKDCFVAGVLRPTVLVSRGALSHLSPAELDAALQHERAHIRGRDTTWLVFLAFLRDLAPWGRSAAFTAFREAREAAADRAAASTAGALNLARALLVLARPGREAANAAVLPMAGGDNFRSRMQALLNGVTPLNPSRGERLRVAAGVTLAAALLTWPIVQVRLMELLCLVE